MDLVDPALLGDMIFQWHETPFCTLTDGIEDLHPQDHCNIMDSMLGDIDLPEIITMILEPPASSHPAIATPVAKGSSSPLWPCDSSPPPNVSDILQAMAASENIVKFPLVLQKGATFDVNLVRASEPMSPESASAPFTLPAVKQTRRSNKREPKSKAKRPGKSKILVDVEQVKENRAPTQAEHIIRERQRRDDMAAKYLVLESLLPPAPKRERAVVVEDATLLVKDLQRKKAQLSERLAHLKLMQADNQHSPWCTKKSRPSTQLHESPETGCIKQQSAVITAVETIPCKLDFPLFSSEGAMGHQEILNTENIAISGINVHTGKEDIVVEMVWNRPPPNFQSSLLQAVENLGSEVSRCCISRVATGFVQCFITCSKPQVPSLLETQVQVAEILITGVLRNLLTKYS